MTKRQLNKEKKTLEELGFTVEIAGDTLTLNGNAEILVANPFRVTVIGDMATINKHDLYKLLQDSKRLADELE